VWFSGVQVGVCVDGRERVACLRGRQRTSWPYLWAGPSSGTRTCQAAPVGGCEPWGAPSVPNALLGRKYTAAHFDPCGPAMAGRTFGRLDVAGCVCGRCRASGVVWYNRVMGAAAYWAAVWASRLSPGKGLAVAAALAAAVWLLVSRGRG
jgi:hypothetical protein